MCQLLTVCKKVNKQQDATQKETWRGTQGGQTAEDGPDLATRASGARSGATKRARDAQTPQEAEAGQEAATESEADLFEVLIWRAIAVLSSPVSLKISTFDTIAIAVSRAF